MTRALPSRVKFRYNAALAVAAVIALIGTVPLVSAAPYLTPILLAPVAVAVWAWRAGTDADADGIVVRALLGGRRIPWSQVDALVPQGRRVLARLTNGRFVALPAVAATDLPRLVAATGGAVSSGTKESE